MVATNIDTKLAQSHLQILMFTVAKMHFNSTYSLHLHTTHCSHKCTQNIQKYTQ